MDIQKPSFTKFLLKSFASFVEAVCLFFFFFLILSPCLFNLNAEYIMRKARLVFVSHKLESVMLGEISVTVCLYITEL